MLFLFLSLFVIEILRRERLRLLRECAVTVSFVRVRLKLHFSYFSFSVRPGLIKIMKSSSTSTSTRGQSLIASARENQNLKKPNSYKVFDYLLWDQYCMIIEKEWERERKNKMVLMRKTLWEFGKNPVLILDGGISFVDCRLVFSCCCCCCYCAVSYFHQVVGRIVQNDLLLLNEQQLVGLCGTRASVVDHLWLGFVALDQCKATGVG